MFSDRSLPASLLPHVRALLHSPILVVRRIAAKALLALWPFEATQKELHELLTTPLSQDSNGRHGEAVLGQLLVLRVPSLPM